MRRISKDTDLIVRKWSPVVENHLKYKNSITNKLICLYCDWYVSDSLDYGAGDNLPNALMDIKDKIDNFERVEILGKYFNPASGNIEYKLKSGKFIQVRDNDYELSSEQLVELFGIEFIRDLNPQEFRDNQLNKIL